MFGSIEELHKQVRAANGLMPLKTYEALYEVARVRAPSVGVEIGTGHGASAIAFTLGARTVTPGFMLTTVDRLQNDLRRGEPSSRTKFGGPEENRRIVEGNFARAGLSDAITLFVGTSVDVAAIDRVPKRIDALLIDADGRFDRDFILFRDRIAEGALVVIDDVAGPPKITPGEGGARWLDLKHVASARLLEAFTAEGVLEENHRVGSTAFCTARHVAAWTEARLSSIALECYRDLVFTEVDSAILQKWAMAEPAHFEEVALGRQMMRRFGGTIRTARALKRRFAPQK